MITSAHWTMTIEQKKAVWHLISVRINLLFFNIHDDAKLCEMQITFANFVVRSLGSRFIMSPSASSYAKDMAGHWNIHFTNLKKGISSNELTKSVPKSMHKIVTVPRGSGMPNKMNIKNGLISGILDATLFHAGHYGGEIVVQQNHVGCLFTDVAAGYAHGDADIGLKKRQIIVGVTACRVHRRIVDSVTGDGDDGTATLAPFDNHQLLLGRRAGEHDFLVCGQNNVQLIGRHVAELGAVNDASGGRSKGKKEILSFKLQS
uniref:Uncharacterized protein n=1 Tax=Romanomermis culicivorax TaxID=13658 RepID=A0A915KDR6_ROMCU